MFLQPKRDFSQLWCWPHALCALHFAGPAGVCRPYQLAPPGAQCDQRILRFSGPVCQHRQSRLALPPPAAAAGAPPPSTPPQLLPSMPQAPIVHNLLAAGTGAGHHSVGRHPQCLKLVVPPALVSGSGTRPVPTSPPGAVAAVPIAHTPPHKHQGPSIVAQWWLRALHDREARLVLPLTPLTCVSYEL